MFTDVLYVIGLQILILVTKYSQYISANFTIYIVYHILIFGNKRLKDWLGMKYVTLTNLSGTAAYAGIGSLEEGHSFGFDKD